MIINLKAAGYAALVLLLATTGLLAQKPELVVQTGHSNWVSSIAFSPDGKTLASGGYDFKVVLWDISTGKELRTFEHKQIIDSVCFSPDGRVLASGSADTTIKLWDVSSGALLSTLDANSRVLSIAFSPDGKMLAAGGADKDAHDRAVPSLKIWDVPGRKLLRTLPGLSGWIHSVAFSPDSNTIAVGGYDGKITLWDLTKPAELPRPVGAHGVCKVAVAFSPDGQTLASGTPLKMAGEAACPGAADERSDDGVIKLWHLSTREFRPLPGHSPIAFSADGKSIADIGNDGSIKLWNASTLSPIANLPGHHPKNVLAMAFSREGTLASSSDDKTIKLWNVATQKETLALKPHARRIHSIAFGLDGKVIGSGGSDSTIKVWDLSTGSGLRSFKGHTDYVLSVAISPDGQTLASGSLDKTVKLWDLQTGAERSSVPGRPPVAFSRDGKFLASVSLDGNIQLFDLSSAAKPKVLDTGAAVIKSLVFSPNGTVLAGASDDNTIRLWDLTTNATSVQKLSGGSPIAYNRDGTMLASMIDRTKIRVSNAATGAEVFTLPGHSDRITALAFSPDGSMVVSGSDENDPTIKIWDSSSHALKLTLTNHQRSVSSLAFSADGQILASASWDTSIKLWNIASGKELATLIALDEEDWVVIDADGRFDASSNGQNLMHFVVGLEPIALEQLKDRYYEPGLLPKLMGFDKNPLRPLQPFTGDELYPTVEYQTPRPGDKSLTVKLTNRGGGIGPVQVLVNGKEFIADARPKGFDPKTKQTTLTVALTGASWLNGKDNKVLVLSRNAAGFLTSSRGADLVFAASGHAEKPDPELYAIVGGVSDYTGAQLRLSFASKDAEDIARALLLGGEKLFGAKKVHLTVLSTSGKPGTILPIKENFRKAFEAARLAKPTDVLVVYLSGHAVALRLEGDRDLYCYLTKEAQSGEMRDPKVRQTNAISSEELVEWVKRIPALKQVIMLDTCNAGAAIEQLSLIGRKDIASDQIRALEKLKDRTGFHVLMGSAADKPSYETSQYSQGLLTYALLEGIKFAAVKNEIVEVSDLFQYARTRVPVLARSTGIGGIQTPQMMAPNAESFPVVRMTGMEQEAIKLEQARSLVLRPRLVNRDQPMDDELELAWRRQLRELSEPATRGQPAREQLLVYLDDGELPSAIKPGGTYQVVGQQIKVSISLIRNKQAVGSFEVIWNKDDLGGLVNKISAELIEALKRIDRGGT
jgi:WD40 repeat protein/uncharacterized caspase-like protein